LRQKHKAKEELAKKEKLQLELKSIYAQLNPHFVFNALSSIQGLINKQDIEGANVYLSDFARLMRDSMTNNNKEQTSLNEEIITLGTYLKLEQLRFGFKYDIATNDVNIYETEIPSLLLQPLIENAVKHGVSSLKEDGVVNLVFSKTNNDMIVEIQDNGEGFVINEVENGYGLKLTRDRIKLLNQLMNGQSIELYIKGNTPSGTIVSLQFKNWFL
jgi:LytS/YehU family sensor histidine kinase